MILDPVLRRIAAELRVTSETNCLFDNKPIPGLGIASDVTQLLSRFLYLHYYLQATDDAESQRSLPIRSREDAALGTALRAANRAPGHFDPGWRVIGFELGATLVRKGPLSLAASAEDLLSDRACSLGDVVTLRFPNERPYTHPNYYMAVGSRGPISQAAGRRVVRIYFDVSARGAPALLAAITAAFGPALEQFSVKVLNHPRAYPRPDAAVAYVLGDDYARASALLHRALPAFSSYLGERIPAFTCRIERGIGVAEEPHSREPIRPSFGEHRCFHVARGLSDAFRAGATDWEGRLRSIAAALQAAGIDPARPYLNLGSPDRYRSESTLTVSSH